MLGNLRVLDLTDERGQLASHILRCLGAEVILVEPPGGTRARAMGPFGGDEPGPERSLQFWAHNRGKKSVVIDLETVEGQDELLALAVGADLLFELGQPGDMAAKGLGPDDLAEVNPSLVYTSISPFGATGPRANWVASDLTVLAASGPLSLTGDRDRPPVRFGPAPQGWYHASIEAAGAALVALHERQHTSGLGQHVDVSAQQAANQVAASQMLSHHLNAVPTQRIAGGAFFGGIDIQLMWPCLDGYASVTFLFGTAIAPFTQNLMNWVYEEGYCDEATRDKDWVEYAIMLIDGREPIEEYDRVKSLLADFFATKTKDELLSAAIERRLLITPVTTVADVVASAQLEARHFWETVEQGQFGPVRHPGSLAKLSVTPLENLPAAPELGEHTDELLGATRTAPRRVQIPVSSPVASTEPPLAGLKVLDLMWVMAGPAASRVLADYGAEVIRVESARRVETARTLQPFLADEAGVENSGLYNNLNAGKRCIALDMSRPEAREIILDLVGWSDVVLEAFSPKAMRAWGLDYDALKLAKPDLVMASTCLNGQYGPHSSLAGFGTMAAAISGFFYLTGWPDRAPCGAFGAYTDYVAPRFMLATLLAAIEHRRRTGEGQYIDFAQGEASLQLLAPALLDYDVNGRIAERMGNDDDRFAPHGVYRAVGDDQWVAIAVETDDQWRSLVTLVGRDELAALSAGERLARRRELDEILSTWVAERDPEVAVLTLQEHAVPSYVVQNTRECANDPQLIHRGHFVELAHGSQPGHKTWVEGSRFTLSRTPAVLTDAGPTIGQHTFEVLHETLGYDTDRIAELAAAELLE
ncbi:MAG: CoA transferase [Acidimicrobiia bacterium]|nr:CoA transferase [Acidimicrobiia bacterium]